MGYCEIITCHVSITSDFLPGRHCCLWCAITGDSLKLPRDNRGRSTSRTLSSIKGDYERFCAKLMLEDHVVPFLQRWKVEFGFLGEQGAESIHARFNSIRKNYSNMPNSVTRLEAILKEFLSQVCPQNIARYFLSWFRWWKFC